MSSNIGCKLNEKQMRRAGGALTRAHDGRTEDWEEHLHRVRGDHFVKKHNACHADALKEVPRWYAREIPVGSSV